MTEVCNNDIQMIDHEKSKDFFFCDLSQNSISNQNCYLIDILSKEISKR